MTPHHQPPTSSFIIPHNSSQFNFHRQTNITSLQPCHPSTITHRHPPRPLIDKILCLPWPVQQPLALHRNNMLALHQHEQMMWMMSTNVFNPSLRMTNILIPSYLSDDDVERNGSGRRLNFSPEQHPTSTLRVDRNDEKVNCFSFCSPYFVARSLPV